MTALPLTFRCEPMNAKLTKVACAGNYRMANHPAAKVNNGPHPAKLSGRAHCMGCATGEAHAKGVDVPLEHVLVKRVTSVPTPPPVTVVPRVDGLLDDKTAKPTPPTAWDRERAATRVPTARARTPIRIDHPEEKTTMPPKSEEERAAIVAAALDQKLSIDMHAKRASVAPSSLVKWLREAGHNPLDWPTTSQANAAALARSRAAIEEEDAEVGDVVPEFPPRAMDHTELALEDDLADEPEAPLEASASLPPFFNDGADAGDTAGDFPGDDDFPPFPDAAVDAPIPLVPTAPRAELAPHGEDLQVTAILPFRLVHLTTNLDGSSTLAGLIHCVYMAGFAQADGDANAHDTWIERAAACASRENDRRAARGAA